MELITTIIHGIDLIAVGVCIMLTLCFVFSTAKEDEKINIHVLRTVWVATVLLSAYVVFASN